MNYRERVIKAIEHEETDLTPWAFEVTNQFAEIYKSNKGCDNVLDELQSHIMFGPYKKMDWLTEDIYQDAFGVQWKVGHDGGDIGVVINKVVSIDTIEDYRFPDLDQGALDKTLELMRRDNEHFRMFRMTYAMYERAWSMMGMEDLLLNMALYPDRVKVLFERITDYQTKLLDYILDENFEGVYFGDDWGQQRGLIMGPACFREFIKPGLSVLFEKVKSKGKYVLLHCCGDIRDVIPDIIEMGCDVYNTVQPEIYDLKELKEKYGKDLTFWGAISTQGLLPHASEEEVYKTSVETINILGKGGGYIFSPTHAVTPDIPIENIEAMLRAVQDTKNF